LRSNDATDVVLPDGVDRCRPKSEQIRGDAYSHTMLTKRIGFMDAVNEVVDASLHAHLLGGFNHWHYMITVEDEEDPALKYKSRGVTAIV